MSQSGPSADDIASLEYDLVSSALAFLSRSVGTFNERASNHAIAFAIVELATAVEVLMKARLVRHDWTQVCINTTKVTWTFDQLANGSARTVRPEDAVAGLKTTGVGIEPHKSAIKRLVNSRNRAVHFTLSNGGAHPEGVEAEYGAALDFVLWFLNSEFRELEACPQDIVAAVDDVIEEFTKVVGQIRVLVDARLETIAPELHAAAVRLACPRCEQPTLIMHEGQPPRCAFCLWDPADGSNAVDEYVDVVLGLSRYEVEKNGGVWPVSWCPWCDVEALLERIEPIGDDTPTTQMAHLHNEEPAPPYWGCFSCGRTAAAAELVRCSRCDTVTDLRTNGGIPVCPDCFAQMVHSDWAS
jgi:hypothetical protein